MKMDNNNYFPICHFSVYWTLWSCVFCEEHITYEMFSGCQAVWGIQFQPFLRKRSKTWLRVLYIQVHLSEQQMKINFTSGRERTVEMCSLGPWEPTYIERKNTSNITSKYDNHVPPDSSLIIVCSLLTC